MKIGIDISQLHSLSKSRGIGYYTENLVDALKKYSVIEVEVIETKNSKFNFDLIHYPFFDLFRPTLPLNKKKPTVVTIHDVIPLLFPRHYPPGLRGNLMFLRQKLALKNVAAIITVSESSKNDICKILKIPGNKIYAIHSAASERFKKISDRSRIKKIIQKYNLPESFVLYAGGINWNKNLLNIANAAVLSGVDVVFAGKGFETKENLNHPELALYKKFIDNFGENSRVHILGFVEDEDLVLLMNASRALIMCSFYEGFGLTILEAQQCGTAVITSNVSSMPEVGGRGVVYVNPEDREEIAEAIKKVVTDNRYREMMIKKGFENVNDFNWRKTALETVKVYEAVLLK